MKKKEIEELKKKFPQGGYSEGVGFGHHDQSHSSHSWMSGSDYGGVERHDDGRIDKIQFGEAEQNMQGDLDDTPLIPDEELVTKIYEALKDDLKLDASQIGVNVHYGEVSLQGTVEDRSLIKAAEVSVRAIPGVKDLKNDLQIQVSEY